MKMTATSTTQVSVNEIRGLDVFVDGVLQEFDSVVTEITFNGKHKLKTNFFQRKILFTP